MKRGLDQGRISLQDFEDFVKEGKEKYKGVLPKPRTRKDVGTSSSRWHGDGQGSRSVSRSYQPVVGKVRC